MSTRENLNLVGIVVDATLYVARNIRTIHIDFINHTKNVYLVHGISPQSISCAARIISFRSS